MNLKTKLQGKYRLVAKIAEPNTKKLISYDFPEGKWSKLIEAFTEVLVAHKVKAQVTKTKSGHVSVGLIDKPTPEEIDKIKEYGSRHAPTFHVLGVEILGGLATPYGYVSLKLDVPQRLRDFFGFLKGLVGSDRITEYKEMKPHVSIVAIDPKDTAKAEKALKELTEAWKNQNVTRFTPKFAEVMTDFEVQDWVEIS